MPDPNKLPFFSDPGSRVGDYGKGIGAAMVPLRPQHYRLNAIAAEDAVFDALQVEMAQFREDLLAYPPPKTDGKYIRTNNLWESWHVSYRRGISIELWNEARYAKFVYGDNTGAGQQGPPWLAPGWPNMYEKFQKAKPRFIAHAQANMNKWANE